MIDIGFWELAVIGVIALIVVGPEKMPGFARKAGHYIGKIKSFINNFTQEIQDELDLDEIKDAKKDLKQFKNDINQKN